ncbi:MAG: RNA methyltransferase [Bacteroidota bacterium]
MLSNNQFKLINQLRQKKFRQQYNLFIVEGVKTVNEFLKSKFVVKNIFATDDYINLYNVTNLQTITQAELKKISTYKSPNQIVGVFEIPENIKVNNRGLTLVLDDINDPGNLGTIIRLCDWFGIDQLVCSRKTVDCYNSKTVQASMGSLSRIHVVYTDIDAFIKNDKRPIYGAFLEGKNIYKSKLNSDIILVMGNEANGISQSIEKLITHKITIPHFGKNQQTESLNVAMATAILLSEFKRFN